MVGVAHRGGISLEDIQVDFQVEAMELGHTLGFGVRERVILKGQLSETERVRLERAARFCPVGQVLNKGALDIEDQVHWNSGEVSRVSRPLEQPPTLPGTGTLIPSGSVRGCYLLDTKEYDEDGGMAHEGEAKVYVTCENLTRSSTWTVLAGHSSQGFAPSPIPLVHAAWAASTATTLNRLLPCDIEAAGNSTVELSIPTSGGRGDSQSNAAQGIVAPRQVVRRVKVPGSPETTPIQVVQAALWADPVSAACIPGGTLIEDEVLVA